jgi:Mlc titration factor MtfA (ptsG expression regulator)
LSAVLALLVAAAISAAAWLLLEPLLRRRRREALSRERPTEEQQRWLTARMPLYSRLPDELRERLHGLIQIFVHEKTFVGCNDLVVTDEMRVVIAAYACLLVVNRPGAPRKHFYDDLFSILVYPTAFVVPQSHHDDNGLVTETEDVLSGQAWDARRVILSWRDIEESAAGEHNVVLHEFAHYLDMEDETMDGAPDVGDARAHQEWSEVFWEEYEHLCDAVDAGASTFLDPYAATEPAEFFAVVTESFFMQPRELETHHRALYEQLRMYYRQDPARWLAQEREEMG